MPTLRSQEFDDIYFSPENGAEESRYVFLNGNNLPDAWIERDDFTIVETGFGTGLNFLLTWHLFEQTAKPSQCLHYVSFEKFPLKKSQISEALSEWSEEFGAYLNALLAQYPIRVPAFHRLVFNNRVTLTLIFDDVNHSIAELVVPKGVDAWYLDGFAPSKNPEMWSDTVFDNMQRLSKPGATFSTFTVAGRVKRGLQNAGFEITKRKGFGRKREMLTGYAVKSEPKPFSRKALNKVSIIGGGLAGTACAYILGQHSIETQIIEQHSSLASGASGNIRGIYNPRISSYKSPEQQYYSSAYALLIRTLKQLATQNKDFNFNDCGSLHIATDKNKVERFVNASENWGWAQEHLHYLSPKEASEIAGIQIDRDALYFKDSGFLSPHELSILYAKMATCSFECTIKDLSAIESDAVILACGPEVSKFELSNWIPVHSVRGQVTEVEMTSRSDKIQANICYGGYISPSFQERHVIGATFQKWLDHTDVEQKDHEENIENCNKAIGTNFSMSDVLGGRASLRCTSKDHFPVVGALPNYQSWIEGLDKMHSNIFVSSAHGSHGLVSSIASAHIIVDQILGRPYSLPNNVVELLSASRFLTRLRKKGQLN